nr:NADH dehydrogenase subunit 2 [Dromaeolus sp. ZM-2022]
MKPYKMMFLMTMISGTLFSITSFSWLGMWIGLEINLLAFIPLMYQKKNSVSSEATTKYFIVQALASIIFLMTIIIMILKMEISSKNIPQTLIMDSALLTKMGAAPFHFWFPEVMEGLSWMNCMLLSTWQKIAPMVLVMYNIHSSKLLSVVILSSMLVSAFLSVNQNSLRKILSYSSINHLGWMLSTALFMETIWIIYFSIYSLINMSLMWDLNNLNATTANSLFQQLNSNPKNKMSTIMNWLNLMGIPPFLGFFPKWLTIQLLIKNELFLMTTIMIISTLMLIFIYLRMSISSMVLNSKEINWNYLNNSPNDLNLLKFILLLSLFPSIILFNWN